MKPACQVFPSPEKLSSYIEQTKERNKLRQTAQNDLPPRYATAKMAAEVLRVLLPLRKFASHADEKKSHALILRLENNSLHVSL
jgi:hypothetical protein